MPSVLVAQSNMHQIVVNILCRLCPPFSTCLDGKGKGGGGSICKRFGTCKVELMVLDVGRWMERARGDRRLRGGPVWEVENSTRRELEHVQIVSTSSPHRSCALLFPRGVDGDSCLPFGGGGVGRLEFDLEFRKTVEVNTGERSLHLPHDPCVTLNDDLYCLLCSAIGLPECSQPPQQKAVNNMFSLWYVKWCLDIDRQSRTVAVVSFARVSFHLPPALFPKGSWPFSGTGKSRFLQEVPLSLQDLLYESTVFSHRALGGKRRREMVDLNSVHV